MLYLAVTLRNAILGESMAIPKIMGLNEMSFIRIKGFLQRSLPVNSHSVRNGASKRYTAYSCGHQPHKDPYQVIIH